MSKVEFNWDGRVVKPKAPDAKRRTCWAVKHGGGLVALETYRINGRIHYREIRSESPRLYVMRSDGFEAVYTTRQEANLHTDPGKRTTVWAVDWSGAVVELSKAPSGTLYRQDGSRASFRVTYKLRRDACAEAIKQLRHEADQEAKALRAKRRRIAKLKGVK